ncbi:hypothetical protein G9A89_000737 [Geosiphon pyriformis]|nr:hypothetical protein G9A89_000737 [Geosiphon pyriformis]
MYHDQQVARHSSTFHASKGSRSFSRSSYKKKKSKKGEESNFFYENDIEQHSQWYPEWQPTNYYEGYQQQINNFQYGSPVSYYPTPSGDLFVVENNYWIPNTALIPYNWETHFNELKSGPYHHHSPEDLGDYNINDSQEYYKVDWDYDSFNGFPRRYFTNGSRRNSNSRRNSFSGSRRMGSSWHQNSNVDSGRKNQGNSRKQESEFSMVEERTTSDSTGFNKLPADVVTLILQCAYPNPTSCQWLCQLRLLSDKFNEATLNIMRAYITNQLHLRYDLKPNFKPHEKSSLIDGKCVIPQFMSLAKFQKNKKIFVCILCGFASNNGFSCPPRDRNGCGRLCFNCYKLPIYKKLGSRKYIKTSQELRVFRNKYFGEMDNSEWYDIVPWAYDINANNKFTRWICFNRMKDFVEKYFEGIPPMTLDKSETGDWEVVEKEFTTFSVNGS